ncbi:MULTISPECIES: hypothetical protein [Sphingobacterium]|uniref:Uncharacterized protein n=1 Tax=Sphingobacterium tenebrionis TaxID=3111775 RepID=A0ABU8I618_9SPHI|nr:hypothetical protein [Sphingobacterium sp. 1.A.4]
MDSTYINILKQKREHLQLQLKFDAFAKNYVYPLLDVLAEMKHLDIRFRVVSLRAVPNDLQAILLEQLRDDTLMHHNLPPIPIEVDTNLLKQLMKRYPTVHTTRYFPELPIVAVMGTQCGVLQDLIKEQRLFDQFAYLCWVEYSLMLEVDLKQFAEYATANILDIQGNDVVLFPADFDWVIVYNAFEDQLQFAALNHVSINSPDSFLL